MASNIRPRDDPLEADLPYVSGEQIEEDEEEEEEDIPVGAYEDEIYGKLSTSNQSFVSHFVSFTETSLFLPARKQNQNHPRNQAQNRSPGSPGSALFPVTSTLPK